MIKKSEFQNCFDEYYPCFHKGILKDYDVYSGFVDDFLRDFFNDRYDMIAKEFSKLIADYINGICILGDIKFKSNNVFKKLNKAYGVSSKLSIFLTECIAKMYELTPDYAYFIYCSIGVNIEDLLDPSIFDLIKEFSEENYWWGFTNPPGI